jgi:hypothetical protein
VGETNPTLIRVIVAGVVLLLAGFAIGSVATAFYAASRRGRSGRALASTVRPNLSVLWPGRIDALRDAVVDELRARRVTTQRGPLGCSAAAFYRPAIALYVSGPRGTVASFLAIVARAGKGAADIELRSGHPFRRPPKALCIEVMDALQSAVVGVGSPGERR